MSVLLKGHTFRNVVIHIDYYYYYWLLFKRCFSYESGFNRIGFHSKTHYTERKGVLKPLCNQGVNILLLKPTISPLVTHYGSDKGLWLLFSEVSFFRKDFDITANRNVEKTYSFKHMNWSKYYEGQVLFYDMKQFFQNSGYNNSRSSARTFFCVQAK